MVTAVLTFGALVFVAAFGWKLFQLRRAPEHLPTWALTAMLGCMLVAYAFQAPGAHEALDAVAGRGWAKFVENVLLMTGSCALMLFFVYSASGRSAARWRTWREVAVLGAAIAALVVAVLATPVAERGENLSDADVRLTGVAAFYLVAGGYLIYALGRTLRWVARYARRAEPWLRRGLRLAAVGLTGMVIGSVGRAAVLLVRYSGLPISPLVNGIASTLVAIGILLFLAGVSYPGLRSRLSAFRLWCYRRRAYHELHPLWGVLHEAFPQTALDRAPVSRWWDRMRLRQVHRRYYRRVIEIRDGLVQLSPYLSADVDGQPADEGASTLREALAARAAGVAAPARARLVAGPAGEGLDADMDRLLTLSRALERHPS